MKKGYTTIAIAFLGLIVLSYGLVVAPLLNESAIRVQYECDRVTDDLRQTDKYCEHPETAPEAEKSWVNNFTIGGVALLTTAGIYCLATIKPRKK